VLDDRPSRREFLHTGGALVVVFSLAPRAVQAERASWPQMSISPDVVGSYIVIDASGKVTLYSGKVELGTGVLTALTQILAEELSVSLDSVATVQGDTALTPNQGPTYASLTVQDGGMQIRRAAATAREALLDLAARRLDVAKAELATRDGVVRPQSGDARISYAQLVDDQIFSIKLDPGAPLKNPRDYTIVGTAVRRLDIPAKVLGMFAYVQDFKLPGMLHARMIHPAAVGDRLRLGGRSLTRALDPSTVRFPRTWHGLLDSFKCLQGYLAKPFLGGAVSIEHSCLPVVLRSAEQSLLLRV